MLFKKYNDIDKDYICSEMHVHSQYTDGQATLKDIEIRAAELRLKTLFFTDHIRYSSNYYNEYFEKIQEILEISQLDIKIGFESKVSDYNGNLDLSKKARQGADIVIGTVHSIPRSDGFIHPSLLSAKELEKAEYELSLAMISAKSADILGHTGGMSIAKFGKFNLEYLEEIIVKCVDFEVVFEINSRYHEILLDWLSEKLKIYNPFVSIGSDVHSLNEIGNCSKMMQKLIKKKMII